jgi:hypothetical protein
MLTALTFLNEEMRAAAVHRDAHSCPLDSSSIGMIGVYHVWQPGV